MVIQPLVSFFLFFDFIHVHHTYNFATDALAKKARNMVGCQVWFEVMPEGIAL